MSWLCCVLLDMRGKYSDESAKGNQTIDEKVPAADEDDGAELTGIECQRYPSVQDVEDARVEQQPGQADKPKKRELMEYIRVGAPECPASVEQVIAAHGHGEAHGIRQEPVA